MDKIEITRQKNKIIVNFKYDADLIEGIKGLHYSQRKWNGKCWEVLEVDPNQSPEEETNLEYVRRIAAECGERRGWQLYDYTRLPDEVVEEQKANDKEVLREAHVQAVLIVLDKLPPRSLRIIRWGADVLAVQLDYYLSDDEDGRELFMELKRACTDTWKPSFLTNLDQKMKWGFVFEMTTDERIVRKLIEVGTTNFRKYSLKVRQTFDDGTAHLEDSAGNHWSGCDFKRFETEERDFDHRTWDVSLTDDHIYCIMQTERHILECLNESSTGWFYFGGSFAVAHKKASFLPKAINFLHLANWFSKWAGDRLYNSDYAPLTWTKNADRRRASTWVHPADSLISHYCRFPEVRPLILELIGISGEAFSERADQILAGKEQKAAQQVAEDKANAFELARSRSACAMILP